MTQRNYRGMLKAYQKEHARIRRADLTEAAHAYNMYNQKQTDDFMASYHENLKEEAYERIKKKITNNQIVELFHKKEEGKEDDYINSLIE